MTMHFVQCAEVLIFIRIWLSVAVALVKHSSYVSQSQLDVLRHMGNRLIVKLLLQMYILEYL